MKKSKKQIEKEEKEQGLYDSIISEKLSGIDFEGDARQIEADIFSFAAGVSGEPHCGKIVHLRIPYSYWWYGSFFCDLSVGEIFDKYFLKRTPGGKISKKNWISFLHHIDECINWLLTCFSIRNLGRGDVRGDFLKMEKTTDKYMPRCVPLPRWLDRLTTNYLARTKKTQNRP